MIYRLNNSALSVIHCHSSGLRQLQFARNDFAGTMDNELSRLWGVLIIVVVYGATDSPIVESNRIQYL